jgi:outer membrane biosynthesis protein TonB
MRPRALIPSLLFIGVCSWLMAQQEGRNEGPVYDNAIKPVHVEELEYPRLAEMARVRGVVVVKAKLDSEGKVISSLAVSGNEVLIPACIANSMKWRFQPNAENAAVIIYNFDFDDRACESYSKCPSQFTFRKPNIATITTGGLIYQP